MPSSRATSLSKDDHRSSLPTVIKKPIVTGLSIVQDLLIWLFGPLGKLLKTVIYMTVLAYGAMYSLFFHEIAMGRRGSFACPSEGGILECAYDTPSNVTLLTVPRALVHNAVHVVFDSLESKCPSKKWAANAAALLQKYDDYNWRRATNITKEQLTSDFNLWTLNSECALK